jgi:hypothetical protein
MFSGSSSVPAAKKWIKNLMEVQETLVDNIKAAKEFQKMYFDWHAREVPVYQKGDWVWLLRRNITTTRPSSKLDFKRLGPFRIDLPIGHDVYHLILPADLSRLHPVFHVSMLLPSIDPKSFPGSIGSKALRGPASLTTKFWDEHNIEAILGYRSPAKNVHQDLVRWRGGSIADDSWIKGSDFASVLHPYMYKFHDTFGGEKLILSPEKIVRILC